MDDRAAVTAPGPSVLARLRSEARGDHTIIEDALGFTDPTLTRAAYRRRLEQLLGFYRPVERHLHASGD
jgi:heme oxygenase